MPLLPIPLKVKASFMENVADWHGKAPDAEQVEQALAELAKIETAD